ncbi:hypothetical protein M2341_000059 [Sphingobium sp. B7D2B]|uniref:MobA/MobL family protein n=1 Tax=Sphingobium sp. B7D2B TaxID=2940583 RepID=UPI002223EF1C|nr:MobA/MobL family protein [Sphingobium sp. B7D2B]MCW2364612.1 hypothetical protein [Sphingobium sp. B7D2B]
MRVASRRTPPDPSSDIEILTAKGRCIRATAANLELAMVQHRSEETAQAKAAANARQRKLATAKADRAAAFAVMREIEQGYRDHIRFAVRVRVKPPVRGEEGKRNEIRIAPGAKRAISHGSSWEVDRSGMRGVHYQQSYISRKSPAFKPGCARKRLLYITRPDAVLADEHGEPLIFSNLGLNTYEMGNAWDVIEAASTRKNAKIQIEAIVAFDADAAPAEQIAALQTFLRTVFDPLDIGYTAAIHTPSPTGDQRNTHAHILFNLRPVRRIAENEWEIGDSMIRELDGQAGLTALRTLWAHAQTMAAEEAQRDMAYTALSYANRGLNRQAGEHLGPARSAQVLRGKHVPADLRNRKKAEANHLRRKLADLNSKKRALVRLRDTLEKRKASFADLTQPGSDLALIAIPAIPTRGTLADNVIPPPSPPLAVNAHVMFDHGSFPRKKPVAPVQPAPLSAVIYLPGIPRPLLVGPLYTDQNKLLSTRLPMGMECWALPATLVAATQHLGALPMRTAIRSTSAIVQPPHSPFSCSLPVRSEPLTGPLLLPAQLVSTPKMPTLPLRLPATPSASLPLPLTATVRLPLHAVSARFARHRFAVPARFTTIELSSTILREPPPEAEAIEPPLVRYPSTLDGALRQRALNAYRSMQQLFELAERREKEKSDLKKVAAAAATASAEKLRTRPTQAASPARTSTASTITGVQTAGQFADGFGGVRTSFPPSHAAPAGALRMPAFTREGVPGQALKSLLYCLARNPLLAEFADDRRLTITPASQTDPGLREAAFFMHCWRSDPAIHDLMVEVARRARAGDEHPWPPKFANTLREFAKRRDREEKDIRQRSLQLGKSIGIEHRGLER